ncbi:hypothetical protein JCM5350_002898 [Sporobolomyces pararoseus]
MSTLDLSRKREATDRTEKPRKRRSRHRKQTKARNDDEVETRSSPPPDSAERRRTARLNHFQNSQVFSYSSSSSKWSQNSLATSSESPTSSPTSLRLLTWNTFSSSPEHRQSQALAILSHLAESRADIVSLQEVSKPFESLLRRESWSQAGWVMTSLDEYWRAAGKDGQGKGKKEGKREGVLILVRRELWSEESEIGFVKLKRGNNEQAKALVVLRILRDGSEILRLATSHFSSLPQNSRLRQSQYSVALSLLNTSPRASHSILLGDFNASSSTELDPFSSSLRDVGPQPTKAQLSQLFSNAERLDFKFRHRPTFGTLYPLVSLTSTKPRKPRRIDRIYVSKNTRHSQYREIGGEAIEGEKDKLGKGGKSYPSDHLAVGIKIEIG